MAQTTAGLANEKLVSDEALITATIAGDDNSFARLVRRHHRATANVIYRMVGNFETALDLTQEVFLRVYRALDRYDARFKFSTWLYRVAMNAAIDYQRKRGVLTISISAESDSNGATHPEWDLTSPDPSPEEQVYRKETAFWITGIVAKLPMEYRDLIELRYSQDLSYSEIAHSTGMPIGTVKNRLFRAHQLLRDYVQSAAA